MAPRHVIQMTPGLARYFINASEETTPGYSSPWLGTRRPARKRTGYDPTRLCRTRPLPRRPNEWPLAVHFDGNRATAPRGDRRTLGRGGHAGAAARGRRRRRGPPSPHLVRGVPHREQGQLGRDAAVQLAPCPLVGSAIGPEDGVPFVQVAVGVGDVPVVPRHGQYLVRFAGPREADPEDHAPLGGAGLSAGLSSVVMSWPSGISPAHDAS
jgi:hypothetical protein